MNWKPQKFAVEQARSVLRRTAKYLPALIVPAPAGFPMELIQRSVQAQSELEAESVQLRPPQGDSESELLQHNIMSIKSQSLNYLI